MGELCILIAVAASSVTYGWQSDGNGGVKYIVQVPPNQLDQLRHSGEITSAIDPAVRGQVTQVVFRVGDEKLPREKLANAGDPGDRNGDRSHVPVPAIQPIDLVSGRREITLPKSARVMKEPQDGGMSMPAGTGGQLADPANAAANEMLRRMQNERAAQQARNRTQTINPNGQNTNQHLPDSASQIANNLRRNMNTAAAPNAMSSNSPSKSPGASDAWFDLDSDPRRMPSTSPSRPPFVGPARPSTGGLEATLAKNRADAKTASQERPTLGNLPANLRLPRAADNKLPPASKDPLKNLRSTPGRDDVATGQPGGNLRSNYGLRNSDRSNSGNLSAAIRDPQFDPNDRSQNAYARRNGQRTNLPSTNGAQSDPYGQNYQGQTQGQIPNYNGQYPNTNSPMTNLGNQYNINHNAQANLNPNLNLNPNSRGMHQIDPRYLQGVGQAGNGMTATSQLQPQSAPPRMNPSQYSQAPYQNLAAQRLQSNTVASQLNNGPTQLAYGNNPAISSAAMPPVGQPSFQNRARLPSTSSSTIPTTSPLQTNTKIASNTRVPTNVSSPSRSESESGSYQRNLERTRSTKSPITPQMINFFLVASILGNLFLMWWLKGLHDRYRDMVHSKRVSASAPI